MAAAASNVAKTINNMRDVAAAFILGHGVSLWLVSDEPMAWHLQRHV